MAFTAAFTRVRGALALISPFGAVGLLHQVVQMGCTMLMIRWVAPEQMGVWQTALLLEAYSHLVRFGIVNAMNREVAVLAGRNEPARAAGYVATTEAFTFCVAGLQAVGLAIAGWIFLPRTEGWVAAYATIVASAPLNLYTGFLEATFRSGQHFKRLARAQIGLIALQLATLPLVVLRGLEGLCGRAGIIAIVTLALYAKFRPLAFGPRFSPGLLRTLFISGLPLFLANYLTVLASGFNRVLLLQHGGAHLVGLYAPVAALVTLAALVPATCATYLLPRLNFDFGRSGATDDVVRQTWAVAVGGTLIALPLALLGWLALPAAIRGFAPQYADAIPAAKLAVGLALVSGMRIATTGFSVLQAWGPMFVSLGFLVLSSWLGPWLALRSDPADPLAAVVAGSLVAALFQLPVTYGCLRAAARRAGRRAAA